MKKWFLKKSMNIIKNYNSDFDETKMDEIRYGLEATYLSITKTIVILFVSFLLGLLYEALILLFFFNILRLNGFGLHASKSWMCWISSSITFLGVPYICKNYIIPKSILLIISLLCILCFILYAPADTKNRPLIYEKVRLKYKILTVLISLIYFILIVFIKNNLIINLLTFAMIIETVLIHPLTYKIFKLSYKNYKSYVLVKE